MLGRFIVGIVVIGVLIAAFLISRGPSTTVARQEAEATSDVPGYSARNAEVVETGEDGRPVYTLNARLVRQRPNDNRVQLDGPRMRFVNEEGTWDVEARSGMIQADGSRVDLFGDVKLRGEMPGAPVTIGTSILYYDTKKELAWTPAPVSFAWRGGTLNGKGLVANMKDGSVRLESGVHGTFPPK